MAGMTTTTVERPWAHLDIFNEPSDPGMVDHLRKKRESLESQVVNVASGMSIGPALYLWTHRLTNTDVVSVVTTTRPMASTSKTSPTTAAASRGFGVGGGGGAHRGPPFDGSFGRLEGSAPNPASDKWTILPGSGGASGGLMAAKGGKAAAEHRKFREGQRLHSPLKLPLFTSPLEASRVGVRKIHERKSECLLAERERFMSLLGKERLARVHLETFACSLIQAAYRGYLLRKRLVEVERRQRVTLRVRRRLRDSLKCRGAQFALGRLEKQQQVYRLQQAAAASIQASFRSFLARQTLGKRRSAAFLLRRRRAARTLQCWNRIKFAQRRLRYAQTRALIDCQSKSAVAIQRQYRRRLGARVAGRRRRAIQLMAVSMIQGQWRLFKTLQVLRERTRTRLFRSAAAIQRIVRGFVARKKVGRKLVKVRGARSTRAAHTLQMFTRRAQARRRVARLRIRVHRGACARAALHIQRASRGLLGRKRAAFVKSAANLDIWRAARQGNSSRVDALYYGQGLGGVIFDCLNTKDEQGDSLLAKVAGGVGPLSLVRVVLKWGADINAVNNRGETALRLAMSKHNVEIVDFLVNNADVRLEQDKPGKSLLHEAAALGLHHLTAQLMAKGLDVNGVDPENGWTPVHYACHNGREELARLLTSRPDTTLDHDGAGGVTALHLAAAGGWEKCAVNLLENRASPIIRNNKGQVPGVTAMLHGHASTSKILVQAFFAAKTAPNRSRATAAAAAAAAPAPDSLTSGVTTHGAESDTNNVAVDATPSGGATTSDGGGGGGGGGGGDAAASSPAVTSSKERRPTGQRGLEEGIITVTAAGNDALLPPGGAVGGVEASGGKAQPKISGGGGGGGGGEKNPAVVVSLKSDGDGFVEDSGDSATTLTEGGESRDGAQSSDGGGGDDGEMSQASNSSLGVTEAVLGRRASEAGVAVGLDENSLARLAPRRWDSDDLRCAVSLAERGEAWCLASLFALGLDPLCRHPDSGDTLGIAVTRGGHRATLEVCLEMKVCFAAKNKRGRTALHVAVARDDLEVAALLLANPGLSGLEAEDLCDPDEDGRTPLHEMAARGHAPTVLLLAADPESESTSSNRGGGGGASSLDHSSSAGNDARTIHGGGGGGGVAGGDDSAGGVTSSGGSLDSGGSSVRGGGGGGGGGVGRGQGRHEGGGSNKAKSDNAPLLSSSIASTSTSSSTTSAGRGLAPASAPSPTLKGAGGGVAANATAVAEDASNRETHATHSGAAPSLIRLPRPLAGIAAAPSLADIDRFDEHHSAHAETPLPVGGGGGVVAGASITTSTTGQPRKVLSKQLSEERRKTATDNNTGGSDGRSGSRPRGGEAWTSEWGGLLDVNIRCAGSGSCPLHEAAASGSVGAVLSLLSLGADVSMANGCGDTALHVSVGPEAPYDPGDGRHSSETVGSETIVDASSRDNGRRGPTTQVVRALLRRGADPSAKDASGKTSAMRAVLGGRAGALRELRETALSRAPSRAKAAEKQELSELALVAISEGHVACLRVLTEGRDKEVLTWVDEEGVPALGAAVAYGQRECIDILLAGAGPASPCGNKSDGNTVLHVAAMSRGGVPVLRRFIPHKGGGGEHSSGPASSFAGSACLELRNGMGDTVLMAALRAGRHDAALLLLQASAAPTAAAHTFRYAWVIAAALRSAALCPCASCVLGRTAEERGRVCAKTVSRQARPGERMGASTAALNWMAAARAARHMVSSFRAKHAPQAGVGATGAHSPEKKGRMR